VADWQVRDLVLLMASCFFCKLYLHQFCLAGCSLNVTLKIEARRALKEKVQDIIGLLFSQSSFLPIWTPSGTYLRTNPLVVSYVLQVWQVIGSIAFVVTSFWRDSS
jgi:hypothetical protein